MQLLEEILILHRELGEKLAALCTPRNPKRAERVAKHMLALLRKLHENPDAKADYQVSPEWNRVAVSRYLRRLRGAGYVEADSRALTQAGLEHLAKNQGNQ